jgi:glycosyltransferase involved in cell wall biosynthesis
MQNAKTAQERQRFDAPADIEIVFRISNFEFQSRRSTFAETIRSAIVRSMSSPLVTVIIPSYNHAEFIGEAVDSVLVSPYTELELVIVDDGSSDETMEVLLPYRADPRVTIHAQENRGAHAAINVGVALAAGDILCILNSDDAYHRERLNRLVSAFNADRELVLVASWLDVMDAEGTTMGVKEGFRNMPPWPPPSAGPRLQDLGDPSLALLETNFIATTSNVAFRRCLIEDHDLDFLPLRYTHDWDFILSACRRGGFAVLEEPLVRYRVHGDNTIREGEDRAKGEMRFEVMWTVIRHARALCAQRSGAGIDAADLEARLWRSVPRFGCETLLAQLLALRGSDDAPPAAYDDLLDRSHPFRIDAIKTLSAAP